MGLILGGAIAVIPHGYLRRVNENVKPLEKRTLCQWEHNHQKLCDNLGFRDKRMLLLSWRNRLYVEVGNIKNSKKAFLAEWL